MAWNEPEQKGSRPSRPPSPPAGAWLRRLRGLWPGTAGGGGPGPLLAALAAALLAGWCVSGLYKVEDNERAGLLRFGAWEREVGPGVGWHLPWPIEDVVAVNRGQLLDGSFQGRLFTADGLLVEASFGVEFGLGDARAALASMREAGTSAREAAVAEARAAVAGHALAGLLAGGERAAVVARMREGLQRDLERLGTGLTVQSVELLNVQVPDAVQPALRQVEQAGEDRLRQKREAEDYAADLMARSRAAAEKQRIDAEGYKLQVVGTAQGDAVRFEQLLPAYEKNPQVLRDRLYIETMEAILQRSRKVVLDGKGAGSMIYLPLDKLFDPADVRGTGVTGVIDEPAPAAAPVAGATPSAPATQPSAATAPVAQAQGPQAQAPATATSKPATSSAAVDGPPAAPGDPRLPNGPGGRPDRSRQREPR